MLADKNRYKGLLQDLENKYLKDQDNYPRNLNQAYSLLVNWKVPTYVHGPPAGTHDSVVFTQGTKATGSSSPQPSSEHNATTLVNVDAGQIGCCYCKETGHEVDTCPKFAAKLTHECCITSAASPTETTGAQLLTADLLYDDSFDDQPGGSKDWLFLQYDSPDDSPDALSDGPHDWMFLQQHGLNDRGDYCNVENKKSDGGIPTSLILLSNQSTVNVFMNHCLLKSICTITAMMKIHCNTGISCTNQVGDLPGYGTVWFHPHGITNILSLSCIKNKYCVTFDSAHDNSFIIHKSNGTTC